MKTKMLFKFTIDAALRAAVVAVLALQGGVLPQNAHAATVPLSSSMFLITRVDTISVAKNGTNIDFYIQGLAKVGIGIPMSGPLGDKPAVLAGKVAADSVDADILFHCARVLDQFGLEKRLLGSSRRVADVTLKNGTITDETQLRTAGTILANCRAYNY